MTDTPTPSPYQQAFFDWVWKGKGSAILVAVAGSGKTWTIQYSLPRISESAHVRLFAFNNSIARELNQRLTDLRKECERPFKNFMAGTFHSVGFGAIRKHLPRVSDPDGKKLLRLTDSWSEDDAIYSSLAARLVSLAKGHGIGCLVPDTDDHWYELIKHHDLEIDFDADAARLVALSRGLLYHSNSVAKQGLIDFDDMLYLPILWKLPLWRNDWVFIDEAQDTNNVRRALARMSLKPGGRLVAVGDPRQAIYGFTGASHDAIDRIKAEFDAVEMPLTISYRCPKAVGSLATSIVPYFEIHEQAIEGEVQHYHVDDVVIGGESNKVEPLTANDVILCRNTAPLLSTAFYLIANLIRVKVLGRDIGQGLIAMIKKTKASDITTLLARLDQMEAKETALLLAKGEEQKAELLHDKVKCVNILAANLEEPATIAALVSMIDGMFADDPVRGMLTLSTVHKAKGREWDTVAILDPHLMPSKWARQEWQKLQEQNLIYVAYTRAKRRLIFLDGPLAAIQKQLQKEVE